MKTINFTGWVIQNIRTGVVIPKVHMYRKEAIIAHETTQYPWRKWYALGWRVVKVNVSTT